MEQIAEKQPILGNWKSDLPASVVVFLVALPLCLGIALASGAPLISGIIAGVVGGIVVGVISGSELGVAGPAAGLAVIVLNAIQDLGSFQIFLVAVILAGLLQVAFGFARAGVIAYYFPSSVITGMLSGIGIVIFVKQIPHALGYDRDPEGDLAFQQADGENAISELVSALDFVSFGPMIIAAVSLAILILWETQWFKNQKFLSRVPAPLIAVVAGILLNLAFSSTTRYALDVNQLVQIPAIDSIVDVFTFPDFAALSMGAVYKTAMVLAVVASLETLLCVEATDKLDPLKRITPTNRELKAQGVGNIVSGLIGGLPVTQVIVRSSANIQGGGKSKLSAISHGLLLTIAVLAIPMIMNLIPLATLAAILFIVGYKLAKPSLFQRFFSEGPAQFLPFIATVVGIVFIDLLVGLGIGMAIAVIAILLENFRLPYQVDKTPMENAEHIRIALSQQVTFLNKASIRQFLAVIPNNARVEIDASDSIYVHTDVVEIIDDFVDGAPARGIKVEVKGLAHHHKGEPTGGMQLQITSSTMPKPEKELQ